MGTFQSGLYFNPLYCYKSQQEQKIQPSGKQFIYHMIQDNLKRVHQEITKALEAANRAGTAAKLIAVSKKQPTDRIAEAISAGQRCFGENRVQEAVTKFSTFKTRMPDLELHLIGPLQTNKVKEALDLFDVIHTVDRPKLAEKLSKALKTTSRNIKLLIQVNTGNEPQKAGIALSEADAFIHYCKADLNLPIIGLMCIPPIHDNPQKHFQLLHHLTKQHHLTELSMGMSSDYKIALNHHATYVRIGTAIFGERN